MSKNIDEMSVFGEYKQKEDRATAALLQIFKAGGEPLLRDVMNTIGLQLPDNDINILSQPTNPSGGSRPDGLLRSKFKFNLYIESKLTLGRIQKDNKQVLGVGSLLLTFQKPNILSGVSIVAFSLLTA